MTFRSVLMWVHLVLGLTGAAIIAILAITGAYITFQVPLQRWLNPIPRVGEVVAPVDLVAIAASVEREHAPRRVANIEIRPAGEAALVRLRDRTIVFVDPRDASIVGTRPARVASLENLTAVMRRSHTSLTLGPKGRLLVTFATAEALLLALSGLWLWWRKKHWQFRPWRGSIFRVSWDLHNATGIWFLVPVLSMVVTGLLIAVPSPIYRLAGAAPTPWLDPPTSGSAATAGAAPLSRVVFVADSAVPGEPITAILVPGSPRGAFAVSKPSGTVYVDQHSGALIEARPHRTPTAGQQAYQAVEDLHTGVLLGIPGQGLMTLGSLMLFVMTITGVVLAWKRLVILFAPRHRRNG